MRVLLVRHAKAGARDDASGTDWQRPLTPKGRAQAAGLVELLAEFEFSRIVSSPYTRCLETVAPLAAARRLIVESIDDLGEGMGTRALPLLGRESIVVCSHGDVVPALLDELAGVDSWGDGLPCAKGSTWVVDLGPPVTTRYLLPPEALSNARG